ncbi:hypothetical protein BDY17DRAFT_304362 [Neohortaea acidophila]|uniref:Uncharacterized protein n=1 Tax=Neohortaea acidophila TaxID=245834 RepID=A0A6A6PIA1_9PEZI|nr:uncharacterized protein BDY17DRAFT_304362 [Neohortaea acidophila]KAF2479655.1 hypothetical protein BDY17DRAFT_304362 [Neohortaea acidophila]
MASRTPMRLRGKRNATAAEKWHHGKQRHQSSTPAPLERGASSSLDPADIVSEHRRKRRRLDPELSRLEQLPTEILQAIFVESANVDLPLASPRLASQLQSAHLHRELTSRVMERVTGSENKSPYSSVTELKSASRLMNSKFFTWQFFQDWIRDEVEARKLLVHWLFADIVLPSKIQRHRERKLEWLHLRPSPRLLPPVKLLRAPFTQDKADMLECLVLDYRKLGPTPPAYAELVQDGFKQAILNNAVGTLSSFGRLGAKVDTELLRVAVCEARCNRAVVYELKLQGRKGREAGHDIDWLDPELWGWAEKACKNGDKPGLWLKDLLRLEAHLVMNPPLLRDDERIPLPQPVLHDMMD